MKLIILNFIIRIRESFYNLFQREEIMNKRNFSINILMVVSIIFTNLLGMEEGKSKDQESYERNQALLSKMPQQEEKTEFSNLPPEMIENIYLSLAPSPTQDFKTGEELYHAIQNALLKIKKEWARLASTSEKIRSIKPLSIENLRADQIRTLFRSYIQNAKKARVDLPNKALMYAIDNHNTIMIDILYKMGARICTWLSDNSCALLKDAIVKKDTKAIRLILQLWKRTIQDDPKQLAYQRAIVRPSTLSARMGGRPYFGLKRLDPAIVFAIKTNDLGTVWTLITYGWDLLGWEFIEDLLCLKDPENNLFNEVIEASQASNSLTIKKLVSDNIEAILEIRKQLDKTEGEND